MSNCFSCMKKFALLNLDRRRCKECEQYFCYFCMPTMFGTNCRVCKVLNTRPAVHSAITKLRSRELKLYLARRKIQTESCIEKEDLIKSFFKYVSLEPQLTKNKRAYAHFKTLNANRYSSTPNLVENQRNRNSTTLPQTPPARAPQTSQSAASSSAQNIPDGSQIETEQAQEAGTNASAFNNEPTQNQSAGDTQSDPPNVANTEHVKLSNIQSSDEIQSLSIKQLKELLMLNRVDFKGCVEKDELRNKVTQLWTASKEKEDVSSLSVDELCKICMDAPLNSVLLECGHIVSCIDCGKQLAECPICRQYVSRVVHTFKA